MGVSVTGLKTAQASINKLENKLEKFQDYIFITIASQVRINILKRTRLGRDVNGAGFVKYSPKYAKYKIENAYEAFRSSQVNLSFTGQMLRSMSVMRIDKGAKIYFNSEEERQKAYRNNNGIGVKKRQFFGISREDHNLIIQKSKQYWRKK